MVSELYKKDLFVNQNIPYLFNKNITEYDMKEAGFSLIKEYKLLGNRTIEELSKVGKDARTIKIGRLQRGDKLFADSLKESFIKAREIFFTQNGIEDSDIISIKKDAIMTTKYCEENKIGEYIEFRPKNNYSSYIQLAKNLELYYNPNGIDIKGISDELCKLHKDYMTKLIKKFINKMETESNESVLGFLKRTIDNYKWRNLEVGYYRNFNTTSDYTIYDMNIKFMEYYENRKEDIDISYNYFNVLMKLVSIPI